MKYLHWFTMGFSDIVFAFCLFAIMGMAGHTIVVGLVMAIAAGLFVASASTV